MVQGSEVCKICQRSGRCEVAVQTQDWLTGLFKNRFKIIRDERCVMCESGTREDGAFIGDMWGI